jgi:hypothetical protein
VTLSKTHSDILNTLIEMEKRGELDRASFSDIPIQVYHHQDCPGISSTTIKNVLQRSWNHHVIGAVEESDALRFGSAFHCYVNEPHLFNSTYYVCPFNEKRGGEWKDAKASAHFRGQIILMQNEFESIQVMSTKLFQHPQAKQLLEGAQYEVTYFSRDAVTGLLKKCRLDAIKGKLPSDLKSTFNASEEEFSKIARRLLYRVSAAFYTEILSEYHGELFEEFYLIPCEKIEPFEIAVRPVSQDSMARGNEEVRATLDKIARIKKDPNAWKGYDLGLNPLSI